MTAPAETAVPQAALSSRQNASRAYAADHAHQTIYHRVTSVAIVSCVHRLQTKPSMPGTFKKIGPQKDGPIRGHSNITDESIMYTVQRTVHSQVIPRVPFLGQLVQQPHRQYLHKGSTSCNSDCAAALPESLVSHTQTPMFRRDGQTQPTLHATRQRIQGPGLAVAPPKPFTIKRQALLATACKLNTDNA